MSVKQTVVVRLEPDSEQFKRLLTTMEAFNKACQQVADVAYEQRTSNKIALQPIVYMNLRNEYGLSSQMAVRAISKACEAYRQDKRVHIRFDLHDGMIFDQRLLSFKGITDVSLLCLDGRELIPFRFVAYTNAREDRAVGQADLLLEENTFFLHIYIEMASAPGSVAGH